MQPSPSPNPSLTDRALPAGQSPDAVYAQALQVLRSTLWWVGFFTVFINLLALTGSVYMLQVYDRVLASRSLPTLVFLSLFALGCLATLAGLEVVRSRLLVRLGVRLDARLSARVFEQTLAQGRSSQALGDLQTLRAFFTGPLMLSLLDVPWMPLYIALVYLLHPWLGHVALAGGAVLLALGLCNERLARRPLAEAGRALGDSARFAELSARHTEVVTALGMVPALAAVWRAGHERGLGLQGLASDRAANVAALAKAFRLLLQVAILGVGAWLVILQQTSAGVMVAASIVMGRALAPLEAAIGGWRQVVAVGQAHRRLGEMLGMLPAAAPAMALPAPTGHLVFENVSAGPPGARRPTVHQLHFSLAAGTSLGITGPSGSGKSSLARLAIGVWRPMAGAVRLDGVALADWRRDEVGPHLGYLPQDIELFPGTVAQNIARFATPDPQAVVAAAQLAGAHAMVLGLPQGYDTPLGPGGANLSGGQRQRLGLARAFYGEPTLVVLDEPSAHLDAEGEACVRQAVQVLQQRGCTVLVVAHRPTLLAGTDRLAVVVDGRIVHSGPTAELMPQLTRPAPPAMPAGKNPAPVPAPVPAPAPAAGAFSSPAPSTALHGAHHG